MLYINGEYEIPEEIKMRMGSLILIDPLSLTFARNPYPYSFWRVNASENLLVKSKENWDRDRRLFDEVTTGLSARNQERSYESILRGTPERRRNVPVNVNVYKDYSSTIGPPSLFTTPGSDLEDLVNAEYMDEKARGASRVKRPANYDFQPTFVGKNPLVLPEDYTNELLEAPFEIQGPEVQLTENPETNDSPFIPNPLDEGISGSNGIGRSLRSGQLG
ncbi:hypothetical protein TWF569_008108 [Orbilia oligospora]|nr:hypothetical protein TWF103_008294 [Orbilia oligospora]KAF3141227.1 hypothetical protein TWF569_008108 [Orbilia oligospora]